MQRRLLAKGETLWGQGTPASSMGVVERGRVGIWADRRLLGVMFPRMVLGESAILALSGRSVVRTASVVAVEDETVVTEYPASMVQESFGAGVPRLVLRTLSGQIFRNALLTLAAHPDEIALKDTLLGLIQGQLAGEKHLKQVDTWERFLVVFETLLHLRDGLDLVRVALVDPRTDVSDTLVRASLLSKELFKSADALADIEQFIQAERDKLALSPPEK